MHLILSFVLVACFTSTAFAINLVDKFALIALKARITYDSQGILATNWSTKISHCSWYGISCNAPQQRVSAIDLSNMGLEGTIAPQVGNLSFLVSLDLSNNYFHASLPKDIGKCKELHRLNLFNNKLVGSIPEAICNLSKLEEVYLGNNQLNGGIPNTISHLHNLKILSLQMNNLTGSIPTTNFNISSLLNINLSFNNLFGSLPMDKCYTSPKLKQLNMTSNHLSGNIPISLSHCIKLQVISLSLNEFTGTIPSGIGNLVELQVLSLRGNSLIGEIPQSLFNISKLRFLNLAENNLIGELIPSSLLNCRELQLLSLSFNQFTGGIPQAIGSLWNLEELYIGYNNLTGEIPREIGNLSNLNILNSAYNGLSGRIPAQIFNISSLREIGFGYNSISLLQNLIQLYLSHNKLEGHIPPNFGDLVSLEVLDLSENNFSGIIPKSLEALKYLKYLNVSFNKLQGEIPNGGPFANFTAESFISNLALCGASRFQVMACKKATQRNSAKSLLLKFILPLTVSLSTIMLVLFVLWKRRQTKLPTLVQVDLPLRIMHRMISYQELLYATNSFGEENLIGRGSLGMVYKGVLSDGLIVAIKVFNLELQGAFKSFEVECEVMRNIRHRNLAKIISSCSNLDFKALVLKYMPNGSLEKWLYSHNYYLDCIQRLNIMIDVASGLEYLHQDYSNPVIHCDLKPSNVLLDDDMVAHITDFGIAKLLMGSEFMKQTKTLGTIGYMAPEYGSEGIASTKADVYSYGIMLMETFVRKKPTDEMFAEELTLKTWVESSADKIMEVIDANLLTEEDENLGLKQACFSSVMELTMDCTVETPERRINMRDVVVGLKKILNQIVDVRTP